MNGRALFIWARRAKLYTGHLASITPGNLMILMAGGGICGLGAALLLARDGHDVTVLERDADPHPVVGL